MEKFISTIIGCIASALFGFVVSLMKEQKAEREAIKSLLRNNMIMVYYQYKDKGVIPYYVKENWLLEYESYKKLKGNSFIDDMKKDIDNLEIGE